MPPLERLKKRKDFLRLSRQGHKFATKQFIVLAMPAEAGGEAARFGFTATKKLGNAVVRNRIKRRLREAVRLEAAAYAKSGWDYVLIARDNALHCEFSALLRDIQFALPRVETAPINTPRDGKRGKRR